MYQKHLERALTFMRGAGSFILKALRELLLIANANRLYTAAALLLFIALVAALYYLLGTPDDNDGAHSRRAVSLITVGEVSQSEPLELIGQIRAVREASVAPDGSGQVKAVYRGLGDFVAAGSIIAELENARERAQVAQARAALEKTRSLVNVQSLSLGTSETSFESAIQSSRATSQGARSTFKDAVRRTTDKMFSNPDGSQPKFSVLSSNQQMLLTAEAGRVSMQPLIARYDASSIPDTYDGVVLELETLSKDAIAVEKYLTDVASVLSQSVTSPSVSDALISQYQLEVNAALQSVSATRSLLSGALEQIKARQAGVNIAKENLSNRGGVSADILAAEANLAQAEALLETTIIRAPISGSINRIDLEVGSFASPGVPRVYMTSSGALEAVAYVTERDIRDIKVGAKVTIGGNVAGSIVRVARALDPITKKAEVRIALPQSSELVPGQSATIRIERVANGVTSTVSIPLSALKITPDGAIVFTVLDEKLVPVPVTLGRLRGSMVDIDSGLTLDSVIVEDARGLKDGETVEVTSF